MVWTCIDDPNVEVVQRGAPTQNYYRKQWLRKNIELLQISVPKLKDI